MLPGLRPYQSDVFTAVMDSVDNHHGLTFSVEIARQGGKNELSAQLELLLLRLRMHESENLVKCSPTFVPQAVISMTRLQDRLDDAGYSKLYVLEHGYIVRIGNSRAIFLSADESSRVVGHTAHLLLEIDEAQDVAKEKYTKEFKPMGATTNVTTVLYGTAWDDSTLLEEAKQVNLELERKDGIRRHFQYDWQEVAKYNPDYLAYVEGERQRLGENHPLFLTQYCLQPIRGGGGFLSAAQRAQLQGDHPRHHTPQPDKVYIAGIDLAGEAEELEGEYLTTGRSSGLIPRRDSTVITIAELDLSRPVLTRPEHNSVGVDPRVYPFSQTQPDRESGSSALDMALDSRFHGNEVGSVPIHEVSPFTKVPAPGLTRGGLRGILSSSNDTEFPTHSPLSPHQSGTSTESGHPISYHSRPLWERAGERAQIKIVEHYQWTGRRHTELYPQLVDLLKNVWHCRRIVVDATGIGQPVASFLREALGRHVVPFIFTAPAKSRLGFNLLAAINSGSLKMYSPDGSPEYQEFWYEMEKAKSYYRPSQTMNFFIDPSQGHDDFLMSLALLVEAANRYEPRVAKGR